MSAWASDFHVGPHLLESPVGEGTAWARSPRSRPRSAGIEKHDLLYPNVVYPLLSPKGREVHRKASNAPVS